MTQRLLLVILVPAAAAVLVFSPGSRELWLSTFGVLLIGAGAAVIRIAAGPSKHDRWSQLPHDH